MTNEQRTNKQHETLVEKIGSIKTSCFSVDCKELGGTVDMGRYFYVECETVDGYLAKQGSYDQCTRVNVYQQKTSSSPEVEIEVDGEHSFSVASFTNVLIGQYDTRTGYGSRPLDPSTLDLLLASPLPKQVKGAILKGEKAIKRHEKYLEKLEATKKQLQ
ncbi:MAG: hypothetical protein Q8L34_00065 [Candidatus Woesearchaeota archaeon]|nr:hypothetical protein [Candidatus Woesearchaeota archaeon]